MPWTRLLASTVLCGLLAAREPQRAAPPAVQLRIHNVFGTAPLQLYQPYTTLAGDVVEFTRCGYYVSNIQLRRADGTVWRQPLSYHLLATTETGATDALISLPDVPAGEYTALDFAVGVDSVMNHSGPQPGVLNPDYGMFWQWESGYIFLKCEGYFQPPGRPRGALVYHIGRDACYRRVQVALHGGQAKVTAKGSLTLSLQADIRYLFGGFPGARLNLKLAEPPSLTSIQGGIYAPKVADNYARMFTLTSIESH